MRTNLYFVRHAHSIYTSEELTRPLSERGLSDAKKVNEILQKENIDHVISSPYKRALQTVEGIAKYIGEDILIEEDSKERVLSERSVDDFNHAITQVWEDFNFSFEGGESNIEAQKRGVKLTLQVLDRFRSKNIVIGTHGNIMVLIMNHFDKKYDFNFWKQLDMPDIYKMSFDETDLKEVSRLWDRD